MKLVWHSPTSRLFRGAVFDLWRNVSSGTVFQAAPVMLYSNNRASKSICETKVGELDTWVQMMHFNVRRGHEEIPLLNVAMDYAVPASLPVEPKLAVSIRMMKFKPFRK